MTAYDYTERIAAVAERITEARAQATVHALLTEGVHALGAENAVFVSIIRDNADLSACRFMLVCEPDWCQRYLEAGCFAHDPWLADAAHHSEPIPASALPVLDAAGRRVIALAMENGFASAALVPAHSGAGHSWISLLCLGSSQPGCFDGEGFGRFRQGARLIAAELHVSKSSINSRFQRMNMKLGVPNRRLAARLAVE